MNEPYSIGKIGKLNVTAGSSAVGGMFFLWAILTFLGLKVFRLRPGAALAGGLMAAMLHFISELWHQSGHARAAERAGYPMEGVHLWGVLGTSIYPPDEPPLPAEIHITRALGGPKTSALLVIGGGLLALATRPLGGIAYMLASILAAENLLVFTLGAFLPLPFMETDGTILWRYRHNHRRQMVVVQE